MTDELDTDPTERVATLIELFVSTMEQFRPGARFVMTVTDEQIMVAFCDHGGELLNQTMRKSSGPRKAHPSNPGWTPPTWDAVSLRVTGRTGNISAEVPPVLWLPGPGSAERSEQIDAIAKAMARPHLRSLPAIDVEGTDAP